MPATLARPHDGAPMVAHKVFAASGPVIVERTMRARTCGASRSTGAWTLNRLRRSDEPLGDLAQARNPPIGFTPSLSGKMTVANAWSWTRR
jgi:hypothetical protein